MLDHTVAAMMRTARELRLFAHITRTAVPIVMIGYLVALCLLHVGYLWLNILIASLTLINLLTYLFTYRCTSRRAGNVRKSVRHLSMGLKLFLNACSLMTIIYSLLVSPQHLHTVRLVFVPLTLLMWIGQVLVEIVTLYAESRIALFVSGLRMDAEPLTTFLHTTKNFVHTVMDEDPEQIPLVSERHREILTAEAAAHRARRALTKSEKQRRRRRFLVRLLRPHLWRKKHAPPPVIIEGKSASDTQLTPTEDTVTT